MIADFLNRDVVLGQLSDVRAAVAAEIAEQQPDDLTLSDKQGLLAELDAADERERASSSGQPGYDPTDGRRGTSAAPLDSFSYFSRDPVISLLQSALDELYTQPGQADHVVSAPPADDRRGVPAAVVVTDRRLATPLRRPTDDDRRLFEQFSMTDIRWIRSKIAEGLRLCRGKHAFNASPAAPVDLPDRARLVLAGDWATGLPRAQQVAQQMRRAVDEARREGRPVHVAHLGDVYYSGWAHEYLRRFLPYWPVRLEEADAVGSWCLNGNHDMYAGGHAYYNVALADPRFVRQQQSSFFSLVGRHWKVLGLDTAWTDKALQHPQADWLADELRDAGPRKTVLLSHHQLFSAYEPPDPELPATVAPILARTPVTAWFWGHEHRCVLYDPHANVRFGRCIGHAGVPVYMWRDEADAYPAPARYEHRKFIQNGLERWALFGFAILDFDGPELHVRYVDENGHAHHTETLA